MVYFIKKFPNRLISLGIIFSVIIIVGAFLFVYKISYSEAVFIPAGQPAHSHEGYPLLNGGESGDYVLHFEQEMNFFQTSLNGFSDTTAYGAWYPMGADNYYERNTEEGDAARDFQNWASIQVDGATGNQTWTYMEFWVLQAPGITAAPGRHPAGVKLRYPTYATCRAITNNNSADMAAPLKTEAEWNAYRLNAPNITNAAGSCSITGGTGSGSGSSTNTGGEYCSRICRDYLYGCPSSCSDAGCAWADCSGGGCVC